MTVIHTFTEGDINLRIKRSEPYQDNVKDETQDEVQVADYLMETEKGSKLLFAKMPLAEFKNVGACDKEVIKQYTALALSQLQMLKIKE